LCETVSQRFYGFQSDEPLSRLVQTLGFILEPEVF
jgi:hypothetical protein